MTDIVRPPIDADMLAKISQLVADFGTPERVIAHMMEAAESVVSNFTDLADAKTPIMHAMCLVELSNSISDLSSWIPDDGSFR